MAKKKKGGKKAKKHADRARMDADDAILEEERKGVDEARVQAYSRLMGVEQLLYQRWEQGTAGEMDWVGEVLRDLVKEDLNLWIAAVGDKVAALGGRLKLIAEFPDETLTLLDEPGLHSSLDGDHAREDPQGDGG